MDDGRKSPERDAEQNQVPGVVGSPAATPGGSPEDSQKAPPPNQPERLTFAQKLFFFLVIVFALFLLYMKLFLEKKMNTRSYERDTNPAFSYSPPEGTWDYPTPPIDEPYNDETPFEPPADTYGPGNPEGGE